MNSCKHKPIKENFIENEFIVICEKCYEILGYSNNGKFDFKGNLKDNFITALENLEN